MRVVLMLVLMLALVACDPEEPAPYDPPPLVCELVTEQGCPRRVVCCDDAMSCWVEVGEEIIACDLDSCEVALDLACEETP